MKYARAEDIYEKITTYFQEKNVPYKENLIGFASDGANVMTGKYNSVMSRLKEEVPNIFLCAAYATVFIYAHQLHVKNYLGLLKM